MDNDSNYLAQTQYSREQELRRWMNDTLREAEVNPPQPPPVATAPAKPTKKPSAMGKAAEAGVQALSSGAHNVMDGLFKLAFVGSPHPADVGRGFMTEVASGLGMKAKAAKQVFDGLVETIMSPGMALGAGGQQAAENVAPSIENFGILKGGEGGPANLVMSLIGALPSTGGKKWEELSAEEQKTITQARNRDLTVGDIINLTLTLGTPLAIHKAFGRRKPKPNVFAGMEETPPPGPSGPGGPPTQMDLPLSGTFSPGPTQLELPMSPLSMSPAERAMQAQRVDNAFKSMTEGRVMELLQRRAVEMERGLPVAGRGPSAEGALVDAQGRPIDTTGMTPEQILTERERLRRLHRTQIGEPPRAGAEEGAPVRPTPEGALLTGVEREKITRAQEIIDQRKQFEVPPEYANDPIVQEYIDIEKTIHDAFKTGLKTAAGEEGAMKGTIDPFLMTRVAAGAVIGGASGDTPEEKIQNALLGAGIGAILSKSLAKKAISAVTDEAGIIGRKPRNKFEEVMNWVSNREYGRQWRGFLYRSGGPGAVMKGAAKPVEGLPEGSIYFDPFHSGAKFYRKEHTEGAPITRHVPPNSNNPAVLDLTDIYPETTIQGVKVLKTQDIYNLMTEKTEVSYGADNVQFLHEILPDLKRAGYDSVIVLPDDNMSAMAINLTGQPLGEAPRGVSLRDIFTSEEGALRMGGPAFKKAQAEYGFNPETVDAPRAVKDAINTINAVNEAAIRGQRRGVRGRAETAGAAEEALRTGAVSAQKILDFEKGTILNAEHFDAARQILWNAATHLVEKAQAVADNTGTAKPGELRAHMAVTTGLSKNVLGVQAEGGRLLESMKRIISGDGVNPIDVNALADFGEYSLGNLTEQELAQIILRLRTPDKIVPFLDKIGRVPSVIEEVFYGALMSNPWTHTRNIFSGLIVPWLRVGETWVAEQLHPLSNNKYIRNSKPGVVHGEAAAMTSAIIKSYREAWQVATEVARTGESVFGASVFDVPRQAAITAERFGMEGSTLGPTIDWIGKIARFPTNAAIAEDAFAKVVHFNMSRRQYGMRQAIMEGYKGADLIDRIAQIERGPSESIIRSSARDARIQTFNQEFEQRWMRALQEVNNPLLMRVVVNPFFRTPMRIAEYANDRTPLLNLVSKTVREDLAQGGARRDMAVAKMAMGGTAIGLWMYAAYSNMITGDGPSDPVLRRRWEEAGWRPRSFMDPFTGQALASYDGLEPISTPLALAANLVDMARDLPDDWHVGHLVAGLVLSQWHALASERYGQAMRDALEVIDAPDKGKAVRFMRQRLAQWVPGVLTNVRWQLDDQTKEIKSLYDEIGSRLPVFAGALGLPSSDQVPAKINMITGDPVLNPRIPVLGIVIPGAFGIPDAHPVAKEIKRLGMNMQPSDDTIAGTPPVQGLQMRPERLTVGIQLTPEEVHRRAVIATKEIKIRGKNLADALTDEINSDRYKSLKDGPDGGKAERLRSIVNDAYEIAELKLQQESEPLRRAVETRIRQRLNELRPNQ